MNQARMNSRDATGQGRPLLLDIVLPIELTNGNTGRSNRWFRTAKVREWIEATLRLNKLVRVPFVNRCDVHIVRILGKGQRLWDADSLLRGNSKELIDAMVACGWFYDDGPNFIKAVTADQDATDRNNGPAVRVQVRWSE